MTQLILIFLLSFFLVSVIISLIVEKVEVSTIFTLSYLTFASLSFYLLFSYVVLNQHEIITFSLTTFNFSMILFLLTTITTILISIFFGKHFAILFRDKRRWLYFSLSFILKLIILIAYVLALFLLLGTQWSISFFGRVSPEQFIINTLTPTDGAETSSIISALNNPILIFISLIGLFIPLLFLNIQKKSPSKISKNIIKNIVLSLFSLTLLITSSAYSIEALGLQDVYYALTKTSTFIEDNYVAPNEIDMQFPSQKRNLIHIYLESFEATYFNKESGGYFDENYAAPLQKLTTDNESFSHTDKFGGPYQPVGSGWTIAGLTNMEFGLPLKLSTDPNAYGQNGSFLPGAQGVGDILHNQGYTQTFICGSDSKFAGRDVFYKTHNYDKVIDHQYAMDNKLIPEGYKVWWGYEDAKLFEIAKNEITNLAQTGNPFNVTMLTADTHFPGGYVQPETENKFKEQYGNVIFHSSKQVLEFVSWAQSQPFYENTSIVLTGDHSSMDTDFFKDLDTNEYTRTPYNLFINAKPTTNVKNYSNRKYMVEDLFPTIISSLGISISGNKLGLGTDLFSDEKTLMEIYGVNEVSDHFNQRSIFYETVLLKDASQAQAQT